MTITNPQAVKFCNENIRIGELEAEVKILKSTGEESK
jgi:hypothetical protein